ncbi:MAG: translation elongation factor Ts [bacterium]|nr:translation elongation factor Ts [bacterium]
MLEKIKVLREETGVSIMECKKALKEADGSMEKAKEILRKWGEKVAIKKSERTTEQGIITSYIHTNKKVGVLLDLRSETDFVAKLEEFQALAHDICMQIAAMNPIYISPQDVSQDILDKEREIYLDQMKKDKKPKEVMEKIIEGKVEKFFEEVCLNEQDFIKDQDKKIKDIVKEKIAKLGENIVVKRFVRFQI